MKRLSHIKYLGFKAIGLAALTLPLISGCGNKVDPGADLGIAVNPSSDALIGPGPIATCIDIYNQKKSGQDLTRSAQGPLIRFNSFKLEWDSNDILYVQGMRWRIEGIGISDGLQEGSFTPDEIAVLIARPNGIITDDFNNPNGRKLIIDSNDVSRLSNLDQVPCGLVISGIMLTDGTKTSQFRARVTIEVIGSAEDKDHNLRFVRQRLTATATYYGG